MKKFEHVGIAIPDILLPKAGNDPQKWAVVACDQYTSEPEYWEEANNFIGAAPSTMGMVYPEVFLNEADPETRITNINATMRKYLDESILEEREGMIYVERLAAGKIRQGLMLAIDLEEYDYNIGSTSKVRATEGTILDRIPPRVRIRENASLELPHIMVLIDDPEDTVIGPIAAAKDSLEVAYDFDLMMDSGHLKGYRVNDEAIEKKMVEALAKLADQETFSGKYDLPAETPVLLYAMGDGNHSLATAKAIWEENKKNASDKEVVLASPTRYALIELTNLHDKSLVFEPIHRVIFKLKPGIDLLEKMKAHFGSRYIYGVVGDEEIMKALVDNQKPGKHKFGVVLPGGFGVVTITEPDVNLPVGTCQNYLDKFMAEELAEELDYVHGFDTVVRLGGEAGNIGIYLPGMDKNDLFKTVILDGALPRKTFSMGEAEEKRFYMECRQIG
jgi:hypothetical protein